jgi:hypothetical protein
LPNIDLDDPATIGEVLALIINRSGQAPSPLPQTGTNLVGDVMLHSETRHGLTPTAENKKHECTVRCMIAAMQY